MATKKTSSIETPDVWNYRLVQVEIAVKEGFMKHDLKLDKLVSNFATKEEVNTLKADVSLLEGRVATMSEVLNITDGVQKGTALTKTNLYTAAGLVIAAIGAMLAIISYIK